MKQGPVNASLDSSSKHLTAEYDSIRVRMSFRRHLAYGHASCLRADDLILSSLAGSISTSLCRFPSKRQWQLLHASRSSCWSSWIPARQDWCGGMCSAIHSGQSQQRDSSASPQACSPERPATPSTSEISPFGSGK